MNTEPASTVVPARWVDVAVGRHFSCAVRDDGEVWCWGTNADGRAGLNVDYSAVPVRVAGVDNATQITAGEAHACVVRDDRSVMCWGRNEYGQLGDSTTTSRARPAAVVIRDVVQIEASRDHTCARVVEGDVYCWGRPYLIGDGTTEQRTTPVRVRDVHNMVGLATGPGTSCAWTASGEAQCWGFNTAGIFGRRPGPERRPRRVLEDDPVDSITIGRAHLCFRRKSDQATFCAGNNFHNALGTLNIPDDAMCVRDGTDDAVCTIRHRPEPESMDPHRPRCCRGRRRPVPPPEERRYPQRSGWVFSSVRDDARASQDRTCFLNHEGAVTCVGQLSYGNDWGHRRIAPITGTEGTTTFDVDNTHGCAIVDDAVKCWGDGRSGSLGDGSLEMRFEPAAITTH